MNSAIETSASYGNQADRVRAISADLSHATLSDRHAAHFRKAASAISSSRSAKEARAIWEDLQDYTMNRLAGFAQHPQLVSVVSNLFADELKNGTLPASIKPWEQAIASEKWLQREAKSMFRGDVDLPGAVQAVTRLAVDAMRLADRSVAMMKAEKGSRDVVPELKYEESISKYQQAVQNAFSSHTQKLDDWLHPSSLYKGDWQSRVRPGDLRNPAQPPVEILVGAYQVMHRIDTLQDTIYSQTGRQAALRVPLAQQRQELRRHRQSVQDKIFTHLPVGEADYAGISTAAKEVSERLTTCQRELSVRFKTHENIQKTAAAKVVSRIIDEVNNLVSAAGSQKRQTEEQLALNGFAEAAALQRTGRDLMREDFGIIDDAIRHIPDIATVASFSRLDTALQSLHDALDGRSLASHLPPPQSKTNALSR